MSPLFLSRLELDLRHRSARRDVADAGQLHRTVQRACPVPDGTPSPRRATNLLHRVEKGRTGIRILVQSTSPQSWGHVDRYADVATRDISALLDPTHHPPGTHYRFRLDASPSASLNYPAHGLRRNRVPLTDPADWDAWLHRQAQRHGFELVASPRATLLGKRHDRGKRPAAVTTVVRFDGHLQVTDPAAFTHALATGIGPSRAYGCGLLSLGPMQR